MKAAHLSLPFAKYLLSVAWALVIAVLFALALDSFITRPGTDSAIFMYVAKGILEGDIPYLDRWDHKGPLLYVLNLSAWSLTKRGGSGSFKASSCLEQPVLPFCCFGGPWASPPPCSLSQYSSPITRDLRRQATLRSSSVFSCQFLTLYLFARSQEQATPESSRGHLAWLHIGIGALGAASFLLRPNLVALWIAIGITGF